MDYDEIRRSAEKSFDDGLARARELASLYPETIVKRLLSSFRDTGLRQWEGQARPPADQASIEEFEARYNVDLPVTAKLFFKAMDGISNIGGELPYAIYQVSELKTGKEVKPSISDEIKRVQERYEQVIGEDVNVLKVNSTEDLLAGISGAGFASLSLDEVDEFILLSQCKGQTVGLCIRPIKGINPGNVVRFEGSSGTYYESINHWLASGL